MMQNHPLQTAPRISREHTRVEQTPKYYTCVLLEMFWTLSVTNPQNHPKRKGKGYNDGIKALIIDTTCIFPETFDNP